MMNNHDDILDEIVAQLDPEDIPTCFILKAFVTDFDGKQFELRGSELEKFLQSPYHAAEVRVVLDIRAIRAHMNASIEFVFRD